eukprot:1187988-Pleurochrysis_carterae.AAC.2
MTSSSGAPCLPLPSGLSTLRRTFSIRPPPLTFCRGARRTRKADADRWRWALCKVLSQWGRCGIRTGRGPQATSQAECTGSTSSASAALPLAVCEMARRARLTTRCDGAHGRDGAGHERARPHGLADAWQRRSSAAPLLHARVAAVTHAQTGARCGAGRS